MQISAVTAFPEDGVYLSVSASEHQLRHTDMKLAYNQCTAFYMNLEHQKQIQGSHSDEY
jgi:hypothetical protein